MPSSVSRSPKRANDSKKASTGTIETINLRKQDVSRFYDTISKTFSFGYKSAASFDDSVSKGWIVMSRMLLLLRDAALESQCASLSAYLQS